MVIRKIVPRERQQLPNIALGFPGGWFATTPIKAPETEGLAVARRWEYREEFVFLLYELAPGFLHTVHERIFPAFISAFEALTDSPVGEQFLKEQVPPLTIIDDRSPTGIQRIPIPGKTARITWLDLQEPVQELSHLALTIQNVLNPHYLWEDWFVDFILELMAARHSDLLVDYRDPKLRAPQISTFGLSKRPAAVVTWDTIEFNFQFDIIRSSELDFKTLQEAVIKAVIEDLEELKPHHREIRETGRKLKLVSKKRRIHLSWLIQYLFPKDKDSDFMDFAQIAKNTDSGDVDTVRKGVYAAARELGITLPKRKRGGNRK